MKTMILNLKYWGYFLLIMLLVPTFSSSQNIGVQELQKFQSLVDDNGQRQQDPLEQPELSQDKNQMDAQELILEEEDTEDPKRQNKRYIIA